MVTSEIFEEKKMSDEKVKTKKEFIYVKLDRERELRYGFKAIKLLEQEYDNKPFLQLLEILSEDLMKGKMSIDQLSFLVYIGLIREDKEMTREKTIELLEESDYDLPTIADLLLVIFEAFLGASPELKKEVGKKAARVALAMKEMDSLVESEKVASGTGASSGKRPMASSGGQKSISGTQRRENTSKRSKGVKKKRK